MYSCTSRFHAFGKRYWNASGAHCNNGCDNLDTCSDNCDDNVRGSGYGSCNDNRNNSRNSMGAKGSSMEDNIPNTKGNGKLHKLGHKYM